MFVLDLPYAESFPGVLPSPVLFSTHTPAAPSGTEPTAVSGNLSRDLQLASTRHYKAKQSPGGYCYNSSRLNTVECTAAIEYQSTAAETVTASFVKVRGNCNPK